MAVVLLGVLAGCGGGGSSSEAESTLPISTKEGVEYEKIVAVAAAEERPDVSEELFENFCPDEPVDVLIEKAKEIDAQRGKIGTVKYDDEVQEIC